MPGIGESGGPPHIPKCISGEKFCTSMLRYTNEFANEGHGLIMLGLTTDDGEYHITGVYFKKNAKDRGGLLNFCPWCGTSLKEWRRKRVKKNA